MDETRTHASVSQTKMNFFDPVSLANSVTNAEINIEQQSPGRFQATLLSIPLVRSELSLGELNQSYLLRVAYPRDIAMFSFWFPGSHPIKIRGY